MSTDGSRELVRSYDRCILVDYPMPEFDKRNKYLELCAAFDIEVLLIIDSDEYVLESSSWDEFYYNLETIASDREKSTHNVYSVMLQHAHSTDFLAYPRIWYKPSEMIYYGGKHYYFRNKDVGIFNPPHQADHRQNLIKGIKLGHDYELRSNDHNKGRLAYQTWLVDYEARLP